MNNSTYHCLATNLKQIFLIFSFIIYLLFISTLNYVQQNYKFLCRSWTRDSNGNWKLENRNSELTFDK